MNQVIFQLMSKLIKENKSLDEIKSHSYLSRYYNQAEIEILYDSTLKLIENKEIKEKNKKNHLICVRMDDLCFNLIQKSPSELIRHAILTTYKEAQ